MTDSETFFCNARVNGTGVPKVDPGPHAGEGYCRKVAGYGTDHVGEGRCKLHGGNAGRPPETGLYSERRSELRQKLLDGGEEDEAEVMRTELAVLRTLLSEHLADDKRPLRKKVKGTAKIMREIRQHRESLHEIRMDRAPSTQDVQRLIGGIGRIIEEHVPEEHQADVLSDLRDLIDGE